MIKKARRIGVKASAKAGGVGSGWWDNPSAVQLTRVENKIDRLTVLVNTQTALMNTLLKQEADMAVVWRAAQTQETKMAVDLASLTAEVTRNTDLQASIVALVQNLATQIAAIPASNDPATQAALDALKATLTSNDDAIAAAVTANTPAA